MTCEEATAMKRSTLTVLKKEIQFQRRAKNSMECVTLAHFLLLQLRPDGNQLPKPLVHLIMVKVNPFLLVHLRLDSIQHLIEKSHPIVNLFPKCHRQLHSQSLISVSNRLTSERHRKNLSWLTNECKNYR